MDRKEQRQKCWCNFCKKLNEEGNLEKEPKIKVGKGFKLLDTKFEKDPKLLQFLDGEQLEEPINHLLYTKYYSNLIQH